MTEVFGALHARDEQLRYFTEIDHRDHMAWAAVDARDPSIGLGLARCIRFGDRPNLPAARC